MNAERTPQQFAQVTKMGRGFAVIRNSATLATTDYEHIAKEITDAINERDRLREQVRVLREALDALLNCPQPGRMQDAASRTRANKTHQDVCHRARAALERTKG